MRSIKLNLKMYTSLSENYFKDASHVAYSYSYITCCVLPGQGCWWLVVKDEQSTLEHKVENP